MKRVRRSVRRARTRRVSVALILMLLCLVGSAVSPTPAQAAGPDPDSPLAPSTGTFFGSALDWESDSAADQAERLGSPSAVFEHTASVPLTVTDRTYLAQFLEQVRSQGGLPAITLKPSGSLDEIDQAAAEELVAGLTDVFGDSSMPSYLRFAPDMNTSWVSWGQQPAEYRSAFRLVSDAVHAALPGSVMVWSPAAAQGYPFAESRPADTATLRQLDTNSNGSVDQGDDGYGPYYPGKDAVDWVGLSVYHDDTAGGAAVNTVPRAGEFAEALGEKTGTGFYATYAAATGAPVLIETAAFYSASADGASEVEVKQAWWRQVFAATADYDQLAVVLWRDSTATRAVVGEVSIDWSVTLGSAVRTALLADLAGSDVVLGPVTAKTGGSTAAASAVSTVSGTAGWVVVAGVFAAAVILFIWAQAARRRRPLSQLGYGVDTQRDLRIDMLRGIAIVFVVVNHVGLVSLLQTGTQEAVGMVSGAELFVLLSGAVLGMVYRPRAEAGQLGEIVIRTGERAWKLYRTALTVVVLIFLLSLVPFINGTAVTTYTDQGAGAAGNSATGRVYNLYTNMEQLLAYPANPQIFVDLALLRVGPWQFNVMGLYVVLLAVSPLILWALSRRWAVGVLIVSAGLYVAGALTQWRLVPTQFENSFPLLVWQVLFVVGMVGGYHRREIVGWFRTRAGTIVLGVIVLACVALMLFSWNNPYLSSPLDARLGLVPENTFRPVYDRFFERTFLDVGRLANVLILVVTGYAVLTVFWRPINAALGWFFIPLGQATLYVFIVHVFFALLAANIPALAAGNVWLNTASYVVILGLLWVMVKTRFLFAIVPR